MKVRGHRIELGEIESTLRAHPGIDEAVAVAQGTGSGNARLLAFAVPARGETEQDARLWR
ncbi:MAG: amino acid adenylation domain-containing protein [Desulfovibrio sp.]|nr:amino acid adenylation domain-containing protein [Desulfovibrio sp.]